MKTVEIPKAIKIAFTGHANIEKSYGIQIPNNGEDYDKDVFFEIFNKIEILIVETYLKNNIPICVVSGMARGVDEIVALLALKHNLPLILSVPVSIKWHQNRSYSRGIRAQAIKYAKILNYPNIVNIYEISKWYNNGSGERYQFVNFARNQNMVDIADEVYSYKVNEYDGVGTNDCIKRAIKSQKYKGNIYDR